MEKYDFALELESRNTMKIINDRIKDNSTVLEFGPANGRLTKYLKNNRNCTVDIVEYNPISGKEAAQYARHSFLGPDEGDIEKYKWLDKLSCEKYDYILFTDVLEHLYYPEKVLCSCRDILKDNGVILISIPNIANNNIVLNLLRDEFNYTSTGLLDDTHIRFFTYNSFRKMIDKLNYAVTYIDFSLGKVGETEIPVKYDFFDKYNMDIIRSHILGNVYQYIFEFKVKKEDENIECVNNVDKELLENCNIEFSPIGFYYINGQYSPQHYIEASNISVDLGIYTVKFLINGKMTEGRFRLDPLEGICCSIEMISFSTDAKNCVVLSSNSFEQKGNQYIFATNDPIIEFAGDFSTASYFECSYKIQVLSLQDASSVMEKYSEKLRLKISELYDKTDELYDSLSKSNGQLEAKNREISSLKSDIEAKNREISSLKSDIEAKTKEISGLKNDIETITSTKGYIFLENLRSIRNRSKRKIKNVGKAVDVVSAADSYKVQKFVNTLASQGPVAALNKVKNYIHKYTDEINEPVEVTLVTVEKNEETFAPIELPFYDVPLVSVVIPVYNQWHYTYACLKCIKQHSNDVAYEVILADDVSTDTTVRVSEFVKNIIVSRNKENVRFLLNCNNAAKLARGKYIVFLNNDTNVQAGWLSSMVNLMESDNRIGMTGSKLIYPDGFLQEAGGILWKDGSAWNYGHRDDARKPDYNYVKEADYISGASIMIRRSLWEQLGGFDERFVPAYYEDTDLAFEVRKAGYKVMYQPASVVVHFEGVSNGTNTSSGLKKYQVDNQKKFFEKWKDVLENEHFPNAEHVFWAKDRSRNRKTVLYVDHYVPHYDKDAGGRCTFQYLKLFVDMGMHVIFVGDNYFRHQPYTNTLEQLGIEVMAGDGWTMEILKAWAKDNKDYIDYLYLTRPHIAVKYLDMMDFLPHAKLLYFDQDLHFVRMQREYEITKNSSLLNEIEKWKKTEFDIFAKSDVILTAGIYEEKVLKEYLPDKNIHSIPLYLYDELSLPNAHRDKLVERKNLLFVGGFNHGPNVDAVEWLLDEILEEILKENSDVKLYIVGSKVPDQLLKRAADNIIFTGFISDESLEKMYETVRVAVIPLRYGAGVKGKVVEAMAHGLPLVTTDIGAEGIQDIGDAVCIENDVINFAKKVNMLLQDDEKWLKYSKREQSLICTHFTKKNAIKISENDFGVKGEF